MLYRLEMENFYSVRDRVVVDLEIAANAPDIPERFAPLFPGSARMAPKVVAIFGANGSGKSTILKALAFLPWFMKDSFQRTVPGLPCERFNDEASAGRLVRLAVELFGLADFTRDALERARGGLYSEYSAYRYEVDLAPDDKGNVSRVVREILRAKRSGEGKWFRVFERGEGYVKGSPRFPLSGYAQVIDKIRPNVSLVSTLSLFQHEASLVISEILSSVSTNILYDRFDLSDDSIMKHLDQHPNILEGLNRELQRIDVGIERMELVPTNNGPTPYFFHSHLDVPMPWLLESHGTRSFIKLFPAIYFTLSVGGIAVIDELDLAIHPLLIPEILSWYYDKHKNPYDAQIWFSCHSVSLLQDLVKEEILITEKDRMGRTAAYSLTDVKSVRRSENLYERYMSGAYGGVPRVG